MPGKMAFTPATIAALVVAASFAAGLNVYATVLTLGLLARAHWVALPPGLEMLSDWWVIGVSGALFSAEFIADKVPGLDLIWNALHTFIRVPVAALLAWGAASHLTPSMQLLAVALGGAIALAAHSSKLATRVMVTPSPEPLSNIAMSGAGDGVAAGLSWLAVSHPWAGAAIALALLITVALAARWVWGRLGRLWLRIRAASP